MSKRAVQIKFWDHGIIGGWTCAVEIDGKTYPVKRTIGDGTGAGVPVAFDNKYQARVAAIAEARRIARNSADQL